MPAMNPIMMIQIMFDTVISPLAFACNGADETCKDPLSSEAPYTKFRLSRPMAPFTGERGKGVSPRRLVSCLITEACGWCYGYSRPANRAEKRDHRSAQLRRIFFIFGLPGDTSAFL
jgi:hypothetical protein